MRAAFEFAVFTLLSAVLLLLGFARGSGDDAAAASGDGGAALTTLAASSAGIESMVADWTKAPEIAETPAPLRIVGMDPLPQVPQHAPARPTVARQAPPALPPQVPPIPVLPDRATAELPAALSSRPVPKAVPAPSAEPLPRLSALAPVTSERAPQRPARLSQRPPAPNRKSRPPAVALSRAPSRAAADSPAQQASGAGGGAQAGQARTSQSATARSAQQTSLKAAWGAAIRSRIERRKRYPAAAGRTAATVSLWLQVTTSGRLAGAGLTRSSGNTALDQAALNAVRSANLPAAPRGLAPGSHSFSLSMRFAR